MRGKKSELEQLEGGLNLAKDPYQIAELLTQTREALAAHAGGRIRYTVLDMADQGRYFHAIKKLCVHGDWEHFVGEQKWGWEYVRGCMRLTEVAAWLPQILNVPGGRTIKLLLHLPKPEIKEMLEDLTPEETASLTPLGMARLHGKIPKATPKKRKPRPDTDFLPTELDSLVADAQSALIKIYELKLTAAEHERAVRYRNELQLCWDRASYNLRDPEHKTTPLWETHPMHDDVSEEAGA